MTTARHLTLADLLAPRDSALGFDLLAILGGNLLTILAAQIVIPLPFTPVPITGLTFGVLLCGAALGWKRAMIAQALYLLEGAAGLPVFAGWIGGFAILLGPTAGYLWGCPFAAALTGWLAQRGWDRKFLTMFASMLLGSAIVFTFGLVNLARFVPANHLLQSGLLPFIPGDLIKAALAAGALPGAWTLLRK